MKPKYSTLIFLVFGVYFLSCATRGEIRKFKNDVIQIQRQLNSIENTMETRLSSVDEALVDTRKHLDEQIEFLRQIRAELNTKIYALEEKIQIVDSKLMDAGLSGEGKKVTIRKSPAISQQKSWDETYDNKNAEEIYNNARIDYSKGNYTMAAEGFEEFIRRYSDNKLAGEAQYWLGDCYFAQGKYLEAIGEFEKVLKNHPESQKVPDALLKLGESYLELREYSNVKTYLNELIRKYPDSQEAKVAEEKLDTLPER